MSINVLIRSDGNSHMIVPGFYNREHFATVKMLTSAYLMRKERTAALHLRNPSVSSFCKAS